MGVRFQRRTCPLHRSHTRAGMSAYKKASPGTNVEIADGNILPVDGFGFGRIELDLDQPGRTTKMVKMDRDSPGICCLLSKQWSNGGNRLSTTEIKPFWGSRGRNRLFSNSAPVGDYFQLQQARDGSRGRRWLWRQI